MKFKKKYIFDYIWYLFSISAMIMIPFLIGDVGTIEIVSIVSAVIGISSTILMINRFKYHWILGIIADALLGYVLWESGVYAMAVINWVFVPMILTYTGLEWNKNSDKNIVKIRKLNVKTTVISMLVFVVLSLSIGFALTYIPNDSGAPQWQYWLDSTSSVLLLFALLSQAMRFREQFVVWILLNIFGIIFFSILYADGQTYMLPTLILMCSYFISSVYGIIKWSISLKDDRSYNFIRKGKKNE